MFRCPSTLLRTGFDPDDGLNELATVNGTSATYDAKGNFTVDPVTAKSYAYSSENLLTIASGGTGLSYDPELRLYEVAGGGAATRFAYDGLNAIAEYDASNALQRRYVFDDRGNPVIWYEGADLSQRRFLAQGELGSVITVTDSAANPIAINTYDEYGIPSATNIGRFQYTGQMWIGEAGMYAPTYRALFAHLGRFGQTDPMGYGGDGPNLYAYVLNDPVNRSDPLGLIPELPNRSATGGGITEDKGKTTVPSCTGTRLCLAYPNGVAQAFSGVGPGGYGGILGGTWQKVVTPTYTDSSGNIVVTAPSYVFVPFPQSFEFVQAEPNFYHGEPNGALHWFSDQLKGGFKQLPNPGVCPNNIDWNKAGEAGVQTAAAGGIARTAMRAGRDAAAGGLTGGLWGATATLARDLGLSALAGVGGVTKSAISQACL